MSFVWLAFYDALMAIAMIAAGMVGAHFYLIPPIMGFGMFGLALLLSFLGLLVGLLAIFLTRKPQLAAGRKRALIATVICALILLPVIIALFNGRNAPAINDITTDFDNSPEFTYAQQLQHVPNRDMKYDKAKYADKQLAGYGPLGPIKERLDPAAAFARVTEVAKAIPSWKITYSDPATGTLEAVATSKLWHFNDDIVIQIRPTPDGASLIEMRSKSRDGVGDFGVNARRIRHFFDRVALARSPSDQNPTDEEDVP
jgi:uncharacterized protein (DUF1499 family)